MQNVLEELIAFHNYGDVCAELGGPGCQSEASPPRPRPKGWQALQNRICTEIGAHQHALT